METNLSDKKNIEIVQLVVFKVADEEYGVEINDLKSIIKVPEITVIPNSPTFIKGIIDLRGKIITILDLKDRFNLHNISADEQKDINEKRIVVAEINNNNFGLIVDKVEEILKAPKDSIKKTPEMLQSKIHADYLKGVSVMEERLILLLDLQKILSEKEINQVSSLAKTK